MRSYRPSMFLISAVFLSKPSQLMFFCLQKIIQSIKNVKISLYIIKLYFVFFNNPNNCTILTNFFRFFSKISHFSDIYKMEYLALYLVIIILVLIIVSIKIYRHLKHKKKLAKLDFLMIKNDR